MKRIVRALMIGIPLVGFVMYLALSTEERIEVNAKTGSIRTKIKYAFVFDTPWKINSTWISESAARQKIATDDDWKFLSRIEKTIFSTVRGCGRAPASYMVRGLRPEIIGLRTSDEIDRFTLDFVAADESKRKQMILMSQSDEKE